MCVGQDVNRGGLAPKPEPRLVGWSAGPPGAVLAVGHLQKMRAAKKEGEGPLLLGVGLPHRCHFVARRGSSDLQPVKAVGQPGSRDQCRLRRSSASQTVDCGWEQKRQPTLGPTLHGVRSPCSSLETPWIGTALKNKPEPGDKAAAGGVQLLPFPTATFPTDGLRGAQEKGWSSKVTQHFGGRTRRKAHPWCACSLGRDGGWRNLCPVPHPAAGRFASWLLPTFVTTS